MPNLTEPQEGKPFAYCLHNYSGKHDKFYCVRIDLLWAATTGSDTDKFQVVASYGKATAARAQANQDKGTFDSFSVACEAARRIAMDKVRGGYIDVEDHHYDPHMDSKDELTREDILAKVDTSRIYGGAIMNTKSPNKAVAVKPTSEGGTEAAMDIEL